MRQQSKRGDPQRRIHWQELVRRWKKGGGTVRAFCRQEGLRESAFYFWRRTLAGRSTVKEADAPVSALPPTPAARSWRRRQPRRKPTATFLPLSRCSQITCPFV